MIAEWLDRETVAVTLDELNDQGPPEPEPEHPPVSDSLLWWGTALTAGFVLGLAIAGVMAAW